MFLQSPVGTGIAAVDAEMPWGAAVNGMVLCGSARSAVGTDRVTRSATADGIGHSDGQCEDSVGVGGRQGPSWRARTSR